jgi:hypothetical protein
MSHFDKKIFKNKKYSELLQEIYDNQNKKADQLQALINQLKPLIKEISDATLLVPLIKQYMDLGIKNDEILVNLGVLIQKSLNNNESIESNFGISEEEKQQLLKSLNISDNKQ